MQEYETPLAGAAQERAAQPGRAAGGTQPGKRAEKIWKKCWRPLQEQATALRGLAEGFCGGFYQSLVLREAESAETRHAVLMAANRFVLTDGEGPRAGGAGGAGSRTPRKAGAPRNTRSHSRAFTAGFAEEETRLHPPDGPAFSGERFQRHFSAAADLLYRISQADGRPERLVARHELDALLAWGETVSARAQ